MSRRINEIELIGFAILGDKIQGDTLRFDGYAALLLDVHRIKDLSGHFPCCQSPAKLNEAIRKCRFTMVYMRYDGKVSYVF